MAGRDIRAGAAFVELFIVKGKFNRGLKAAQAKLRAFSASVDEVGRKLIKMSSLLAVPLLASAKIFASFSDSMLEVKAITGATDQEFEKLNATAKELGRTTSFTAKQVAQGMGELARSGKNTVQILRMIPDMLNLARATSTDLASATKIAVGTMNAFELGVDQTTRVVDTLTKGTLNAAMTMEELGEALVPVSSIAFEAKESLENTVAAIGVMANVNIKGSKAGYQLARAYKELTKQAKADVLFRDLAVSVADANGNLRPMNKILLDVNEALRDAGTQTRIARFEQIFGRGAIAAIKLARTGVDDLAKKIREAGVTAKKISGIMDSGLGGSIRKLLSAIEGAAIEIGEALAPMLKDLAKEISSIAQRVATFVRANQGLIVSVAKITALVAGAGIALIGLGAVFGSLANVIGLASGALTLFGTTIGTVGALLAGLLSPMKLVIVGVGALTAAILTEFSTGEGAIKSLGNAFTEVKGIATSSFQAMLAALKKNDLSAATNVMWKALILIYEKGILELKKIWVGFQKSVSDVIFSIKEVLIQSGWMEPILEGIFAIRVAWHDLTSTLSILWKRFINFFIKSWNRLKKVVIIGKKVFSPFDPRLAREWKQLDVEYDKIGESVTKAQDEARKKLMKMIAEQSEKLGELRESIAIGEAGRAGRQQQAKLKIDEQLNSSKKAVKKAEEAWRNARRVASFDARKIGSLITNIANQAVEHVIGTEGKKEAASKAIESKVEKGVKEAVKDIKTARVPSQMERVDQQITTRGAFNVSNLLGFRGISGVDDVERNTKDTAEAVRETNRILKKQKPMSFK